MKSIAFRIRDFRSIKDSGICELSGDGITVLAGQNESGKTAVLSALRDFDVSPGDPPKTPEFLPEGDDEAKPEVAVQFSIAAGELERYFSEESFVSPPAFLAFINTAKTIWITRDLTTNRFRFDREIQEMWNVDESSTGGTQTTPPETKSVGAAVAQPSEMPPPVVASEEEHLELLHSFWAPFVYFDSFSDTLPRSVDVSVLVADKEVPQIVSDFLRLADIDSKRLVELADDPKQLGNYLDRRNAVITGDFLTYWKQRTGRTDAVGLHARSFRDGSGVQKLAFFVRDRVDQYPDQRSRGFLWFLSFYLRLAAVQKQVADGSRILLLDEPGSYLHARAQRDILHLFEQRLAAAGQRVIYTTHSPYLLPADGLHRIRLVLKHPTQGTLVLDRLTHPAVRGEEFADTLSPVMTSIGLDIQGTLSLVREKNLLVEGITDYLYVARWASEMDPELLEKVNVFPCFGAATIPTLASLLVGWGLPFAVLLDRDAAGQRAMEKLHRDLLVPHGRIVQPKDALAIEDLFSADDFRSVLQSLDPTLTLLPEERPTAAIERQKIDKLLLARRFAELHSQGSKLTARTRTAVLRLLKDIRLAIDHSE